MLKSILIQAVLFGIGVLLMAQTDGITWDIYQIVGLIFCVVAIGFQFIMAGIVHGYAKIKEIITKK